MTMTEGLPLSDRVKARLEAGETEGAGTNVCVKCKGPKPGRYRSDRCRECNGRQSGKTKANGKPELVQGVSLNVVSEQMGLLVALAKAADLSLRDYASGVMREHLSTQQFPDLPEEEQQQYQPTAFDWARLNAWVSQDVTRLAPYKGKRTGLKEDPDARAALYAWALTQGFVSTPS